MSLNNATFRFYQELNDFLPSKYKKKSFHYSFRGNPTVKDSMEAIGVPHPEVELILVNGKSVNFSYHLQNKDFISVYPMFESFDITSLIKLHPRPLRITKFILDIQLGTLAKKLRMLGFDTLYKNNYVDKQIIEIAWEEHRIILTRDKALLKNKLVTHGYWVRNTDPEPQFIEIIQRFDLKNQINPFTRCMVCNQKVVQVEKDEIADQLQPKTKKYFNEFFQCVHCKKIYWKGSHFQKMKQKINTLLP